MCRLYDASVDEKKWTIKELDNKNYYTYKLINKENGEIYYFKNIIGFEQVTDDEFLVYRRANYDNFEIVRYKLQNSKLKKLFVKEFSQFEFISDDRILFTFWGSCGPYRCSGVYSIKDNSMLEEAKWLKDMAIDIYEDDEENESNTDEIKLYVEDEIFSYKLGNQKILFTVDPKTLEPNSDCYSQLRGCFIKVNSKEDIENIKLEEKNYIRIIEEHMGQQENDELKKAKEKLLVRKMES